MLWLHTCYFPSYVSSWFSFWNQNRTKFETGILIGDQINLIADNVHNENKTRGSLFAKLWKMGDMKINIKCSQIDSEFQIKAPLKNKLCIIYYLPAWKWYRKSEKNSRQCSCYQKTQSKGYLSIFVGAITAIKKVISKIDNLGLTTTFYSCL